MAADDIVTRLRQKYAGQLPICAEAADEIELLRELLDAYKNFYHLRTKLSAAVGDE